MRSMSDADAAQYLKLCVQRTIKHTARCNGKSMEQLRCLQAFAVAIEALEERNK